MKLLEDVDLRLMDECFVLAQPAHLQKLEERELDACRAAFARSSLS